MGRMESSEAFSMRAFAIVVVLVLSLSCPSETAAYAVLAHEAIIDSVWDTNIGGGDRQERLAESFATVPRLVYFRYVCPCCISARVVNGCYCLISTSILVFPSLVSITRKPSY